MFCLLILFACGEGTIKKQNSVDILKEGSVLFSKYGCIVCHSLDGKVIYGPPLNDLYLNDVVVIRQGKVLTLVADREYLIRAIRDPGYEEVLEYQNKAMPIPHFSKKSIEILVDYLIALDEGKKSGE